MNVIACQRRSLGLGLGAAIFLIPSVVLAQGGIVSFRNDVLFQTPGDRLIRWPDGTGITGTNYVAQLYYGPNSSTLIPVINPPAPFRPYTTTAPGTWLGGNRTLSGFGSGSSVTLEVRFWNRNHGETFEQAMTNGFAVRTLPFNYTIPQAGGSTLMEGFSGRWWLDCPTMPTPIIHVQPTNQTVMAGSNVTLRVVAEYPCGNQWYFNDAPIPNAGGSSLTISNFQAANAGDYHVVVTNRGFLPSIIHATTSQVAVLTVVGPPAGDGVVNFNNSVLPEPPDRRFYNVDGVTPLAGTNFVAQLYYGSDVWTLRPVPNSPARFRPPGAPQPGTWLGGNRTLSGFAAGSVVTLAVLVWDSTYGSTPEEAATRGEYAIGTHPFTYLVPAPNLGPTNYFMYNFVSCGPLVCCDNARIPSLESQPQGRTVTAGSDVILSARTSSHCFHEWRFNVTNSLGSGGFFGGSGSNYLVLSNVQPHQSGRYQLLLGNYAGAVTSAVAVLTVVAPGHLGAVARTGSEFRFYVPGESGQSFAVETTTNLTTSLMWESVLTNTAPFWFTNSTTDADRQRFYRAVLR